MALPTAPLGKVLRQNLEYIGAPEPRLYKKLSVRLYGRGVVLDTPADGATLKMRKHQLAKPGQVIVSEIWGKKGALGIVPPEGEGALCTSHFYLFDIDSEAAAPEWIRLILESNYLEEQLDGEARGTTGYAAVRPKHLLAATIPLPSVSEQTRIATRVQQAIAALDRVAALHTQTVVDVEGLLISLAHRDDLTEKQKLERGWRKLALRETMRRDTEVVRVGPLGKYPSAGCYSFARGLFRKQPIVGLEWQSETLFRLRTGQFTYLKLKAFEGAFAFVSEEFDGCYVSNEYPAFSPVATVARAEWVFAYFKAERVWAALASGSKGIGARRERVNPNRLLEHEAWVPPLEDQNRIAEILAAQRRLWTVDTFRRDEIALRQAILSMAFRGEL